MSGEKRAALCWGQRATWLRQHLLPAARSADNRMCRYPLPAGVGLPVLRAVVDQLVRRHEALRTTFHFDADEDPWQQVHPPAPLPIVTVTTERDGTPSPADVVDELARTEFEVSKEWPIRVAVITTGGQPRHLVLVLNHLAFDAWTVDRYEHELQVLRGAIVHRRPAVLEPVRHQPLDLARYETTGTALAAKATSLDFWRAEVAELPTDVLAGRRNTAPAGGPSVRSMTLTSPGLLPAVRQIAARHQVWPSVVHTAAYVALTAISTGSERVPFLSFNGNRAGGSHDDVLTCLSTPRLNQLDCTGNPTFGELLRRVTRQQRRADGHTFLPQDELLELLAAEGFRRGTPVRVTAEFNFLANDTRPSGLRRTTLTPNPAPLVWASSDAETHFRVSELPDAVSIGLNATSTVLDAVGIERFLRGHEATVLAHLDENVDLRLDQIAGLTGLTARAASPEPAGEPATTEPAEPAAEALDTLLSLVAKANRLTTVDGNGCYVSAGGRVLRAPRVLALLHDHGWRGLTVAELAGPLPLRVLAARLARTG